MLEAQRNYQTMIILAQTSRGEINWCLQQLEHWNGKQIRMSSNPDLVIETDGDSMSYSELMDGGPWNPSEKQKLHYQCTGTESSTVCNSITDQTQTEHSYSHQFRKHISCCIPEQNVGWGPDQNCYYKQQNKFGLTIYPSRLGESSDEGYQQLDAEQGDIQTHNLLNQM